MAGLSVASSLLDPTDARVGCVEEVFDRLDRNAAAFLGDFQVLGFEAADPLFGDDLLGLLTGKRGLKIDRGRAVIFGLE